MRIEDKITIDAPAEVLWALTIDVENWPSLTSTVTSVQLLDDEPLGLGSRARIKQPAQRPAVWTVTEFDPPSRFVWECTTMGTKMSGTHDIESLPDGSTVNTLGVEMTGPTSGLLGLVAGRSIRKAIHTENQGFRAHAEAASYTP